LADRYERGLGEYGAARGLVAQGLLMPVLTGQLSPGAVRVTWEQPAQAWRRQLEHCGYHEVCSPPAWRLPIRASAGCRWISLTCD